MKRFQQVESNISKVNTPVAIPFELDLSSVVTGEDKDHKYILYATSNHIGENYTGGHYTAFCSNSDSTKWYRLDDSTVSEIPDPSTTIFGNGNKTAYILFYKRNDTVALP